VRGRGGPRGRGARTDTGVHVGRTRARGARGRAGPRGGTRTDTGARTWARPGKGARGKAGPRGGGAHVGAPGQGRVREGGAAWGGAHGHGGAHVGAHGQGRAWEGGAAWGGTHGQLARTRAPVNGARTALRGAYICFVLPHWNLPSLLLLAPSLAPEKCFAWDFGG
jgi:hypothetical protein